MSHALAERIADDRTGRRGGKLPAPVADLRAGEAADDRADQALRPFQVTRFRVAPIPMVVPAMVAAPVVAVVAMVTIAMGSMAVVAAVMAVAVVIVMVAGMVPHAVHVAAATVGVHVMDAAPVVSAVVPATAAGMVATRVVAVVIVVAVTAVVAIMAAMLGVDGRVAVVVVVMGLGGHRERDCARRAKQRGRQCRPQAAGRAGSVSPGVRVGEGQVAGVHLRVSAVGLSWLGCAARLHFPVLAGRASRRFRDATTLKQTA